MKRATLAVLLILFAAAIPQVSSAQEPTSSAAGIAETSSDAVRAQALLARAVSRIKEVGDRALPEFGRQGEFTDKELYVYVLDTNGTMLTSGGSSATLIGRNLSQMRDVTGKPFFAEILDKARTVGYGEVDYRWLNWADNSVQRKHAYFEKVGDRILSVATTSIAPHPNRHAHFWTAQSKPWKSSRQAQSESSTGSTDGSYRTICMSS